MYSPWKAPHIITEGPLLPASLEPLQDRNQEAQVGTEKSVRVVHGLFKLVLYRTRDIFVPSVARAYNIEFMDLT